MKLSSLSFFAVAFFAVICAAGTVLASDIEVSDAWVRAPIGQVNVTAGYFTLTNTGAEQDTLLSVESTLAAKTEIHTTFEGEGGMMRMRPVPQIVIPAGGTHALKPGADHLMLMGLEQTVEDGDTATLRLTFQRSGIIEVVVPVARRNPFE